uniref:Uncharacterized protein n=1 Tax=Setaria viridis TaxID=4556 RepID=A0A4U6SXI0_SETVI|nr:hypothetical protein SEVIR_9G142900v2 [Setaria viridis]
MMTAAYSPFHRLEDREPRPGGCCLPGGRIRACHGWIRVPPLAAPSAAGGQAARVVDVSPAVGGLANWLSRLAFVAAFFGSLAPGGPRARGGGSDFWGGNGV